MTLHFSINSIELDNKAKFTKKRERPQTHGSRTEAIPIVDRIVEE